MEENWILFYREHDLKYYLFNGSWPICVSEHKELWELDENGTPVGLRTLQEANNNKRKRGFIVNKVRFSIVAKGTFVKEED